MARSAICTFVLCLALSWNPAAAFYLPGVAPQDFKKGDPITLKVNKLMSAKNLPFEYYSLPYCRPNSIVSSAENLGEVLRGDRILNSPYTSEFLKKKQCSVLCRIQKLSKPQADLFRSRIQDEYRVNMILDNLPIGIVHMRQKKDKKIKSYDRGWPVGVVDPSSKAMYLTNHLSFTVLHRKDPVSGLSRIVGFEVAPTSVKHTYEEWKDGETVLNTCGAGAGAAGSGLVDDVTALEVKEGAEVVFTYDVAYAESDLEWSSRWDTYLVALEGQVHWFSIVNSAMIVLLLTGMVAMILLRALRRDISIYNTMDDDAEESGWKLVHGDVLRAPRAAGWLAALLGSGVQLLGCAGATLVFALAGFLSPANRGGLTTAMLLLFVALGGVGGYASARVYKGWAGAGRRTVTLRTALAFPGLVAAVFLALNFLVWGQRSTGAVPFSTLAALTLLWFGISVPLCFAGASLGYRSTLPEDPVRTNKIPRQVPPQPSYLHPILSVLVGGVLPFGAVFIELFFLMSSMWQNQFYYLFGFLALVALILVATCAEISIVFAYFQLCAEDYHWHWRSFLVSASSAVYLYAFAVVYFVTRLDITKFVPMILYFGYMALVSCGFALMTGAIGFYATNIFVRKIYGAVKFD